MDREGTYHFTAIDSTNGVLVYDQIVTMEPNYLFKLVNLVPGRRYDFDLKFVRAGEEFEIPDAAGSVTTYPSEEIRGSFTFAFGSCANPDDQEAQGSWTAIRRLANIPRPGMSPLRLFIHLGDSFYFYDHMTESPVENVETAHAAHLSMRRNIEFLNMAREVPCCGIWDDHDYAGDNTESVDIPLVWRMEVVKTWRQYWGNEPLSPERDDLGLTTRISYGPVDIYLLDSRYWRRAEKHIYFGEQITSSLLQMIDNRRNTIGPRVVVLATGSNWTKTFDGSENYGDSDYEQERENFFKELRTRMGNQNPMDNKINGLLLLSGDNHINEIFHVDLGDDKMAPEFLSSPLTLNSGLEDEAEDIEGERVWSHPSGGSKGRRGFATLTIQTSTDILDNWRATVRYFQEAFAAPYAEFTYVTSNGQFIPI